jgi:hypothetical protein
MTVFARAKSLLPCCRVCARRAGVPPRTWVGRGWLTRWEARGCTHVARMMHGRMPDDVWNWNEILVPILTRISPPPPSGTAGRCLPGFAARVTGAFLKVVPCPDSHRATKRIQRLPIGFVASQMFPCSSQPDIGLGNSPHNPLQDNATHRHDRQSLSQLQSIERVFARVSNHDLGVDRTVSPAMARSTAKSVDRGGDIHGSGLTTFRNRGGTPDKPTSPRSSTFHLPTRRRSTTLCLRGGALFRSPHRPSSHVRTNRSVFDETE